MKKLLLLIIVVIGMTVHLTTETSVVPLQTEKMMMKTKKTNEELVNSDIKKPSLSSGGLSQITEMMREIVRKEQRKQTKEIKKNNIGQEKS